MSDLAAGSSGSQIERSALTSHPASAPRPCSGLALLGAGTPSWLLFIRYSVPVEQTEIFAGSFLVIAGQQLGRCALAHAHPGVAWCRHTASCRSGESRACR